MMATRIPFVDGEALALQHWLTDVFRWRLFEGDWIPNNATEVFIADIDGTEIAGGGYIVQLVASPTVVTIPPTTPNDVGFVAYDCSDPDFGTLSSGQTAAWLVLEARQTTDADSPIVAAFSVLHECDGLTDAEFPLPATYGALAVATTCSAAF